MRLGDLITEAGLAASGLLTETIGELEVDITALCMDSQRVTAGALFACVAGHHADGHNYASAAMGNGAVALLNERRLDLALPQVVVRSVREALGPVSDAFFGHPSAAMTTVGVTGTNGKTTTAALLGQVFEMSGWRTAVIGTLTQARTTPEAPDLQSMLAEARAKGGRAVVMEVSSHALDQHRVDAVRFAAGVFTNLTQDHLDYHLTMDAYFEAKARLFEPGRSAVAVINRDDRWGQRLIARLESRRALGQVVESFGLDDAKDLVVTPQGSSFRWDGAEVRLRIGGRFNVANALAAASVARALGIGRASIAEGLGALQRVPGRFESVDAGQPFTVLVDYAHTPDGLEHCLGAAREMTSGALIVVFGAGGDRDHDKRPKMGEVATRLADLVFVTSDNPRHEDPDSIIEQVVAGAVEGSHPVVVADRSQAIAAAVANATAGDVVVVAGKGHETGQDVGGRVLPFDDAAEIRSALRRILASRRGHGAQARQ